MSTQRCPASEQSLGGQYTATLCTGASLVLLTFLCTCMMMRVARARFTLFRSCALASCLCAIDGLRTGCTFSVFADDTDYMRRTVIDICIKIVRSCGARGRGGGGGGSPAWSTRCWICEAEWIVQASPPGAAAPQLGGRGPRDLALRLSRCMRLEWDLIALHQSPTWTQVPSPGQGSEPEGRRPCTQERPAAA